MNAFDQQAAHDGQPARANGGGQAAVFGAGPERVWGYAGFWWRLLAWILDELILGAAATLFGVLVSGRLPFAVSGSIVSHSEVSKISDLVLSQPTTFNWSWNGVSPTEILGLLLTLAYFTAMESSRWQATIGKRICGLRVTGLDGGRITWRRALGRYLGKFLSGLILGIGFLMVGWTRRKQGLHDILADTLVVRLRAPSDLVRFNPPT